MKAWLLSLNKTWIANTGATLVGVGVAYNAANLKDPLASVIGSIATAKVTAIVNLLSAIGLAMTYLGKPATVNHS